MRAAQGQLVDAPLLRVGNQHTHAAHAQAAQTAAAARKGEHVLRHARYGEHLHPPPLGDQDEADRHDDALRQVEGARDSAAPSRCRALQLYSAPKRSTSLQLYSALHSTSSTPSLSKHLPVLSS